MTFPLIKTRAVILKNSFYPVNISRVFKAVFFVIVGVVFFAGTFLLFDKIISYLISFEDFQEIFVKLFLERLMAMIYLMSLSMLIFSNVVTSLSCNYLSKDLDNLLSLPLSHMKVFFSKSFEAFFNSSYIIVLLIVPVLISYGTNFGAGIGYYLWMIPSLVLFLIIPWSAGITVTIILMRFLPAHKTYRIMMVMSLIFIVILVFSIRLIHPEKLFNPEETDDFVTLIQSISFPGYEKLPSTWVAKTQFGYLNDEMIMFRSNILKLAIFALTGILIMATAAKLLYYRGWTETGRSEKVTLSGKWRFKNLHHITSLLLGRRNGALLEKDLKLFFRDTSQWSQLLLLGALVILYVYNITNIPFPHPVLKSVISFLNLGMAGFVLAAIGVRFVFPSVSQESGSFWIIKTSPVKLKDFLKEKFIISFLPLFLLAEILIISSNLILNVEPFLMALSVLTIFFISLAITGFGVGLGAAYPNFKAENQAKTAGSLAGILYMLISLLYIGVVLVIESWPVYLYFSKPFHPDRSERYFFVGLAYFAVVLISLLFAVIPVWIGHRRLNDHEV